MSLSWRNRIANGTDGAAEDVDANEEIESGESSQEVFDEEGDDGNDAGVA